MNIPPDFLAEVEGELEAAHLELTLNADRISALAELRGLAVYETLRGRRPLAITDLLTSAPDEPARARIHQLLRWLRQPPAHRY